MSFEERLSLADRMDSALVTLFQQLEFTVERTGYEDTVSDFSKAELRKIHDNPTVTFLRYLPDLFLWSKDKYFFVELKVMNSPIKSPKRVEHLGAISKINDLTRENIGVVETAAIRNYERLTGIGVEILLIVFCTYNPKEILAEWEGKITKFFDDSVRIGEGNASFTPYTNIHLDKMRTLKELFKVDLNIEIDDSQVGLLKSRLKTEPINMDKHYWKDAYKEFWEISSKKEAFVKKLIEKETGLEVVEIGMGTGSNAFISGSATDNNFEKGDADLYVKKADAFIEVTGPNISMPLASSLWFRPDKLNNTFDKVKNGRGKLHLVIHIQEIKGTNERIIRGIHLDREFFDRVRKVFKKVHPVIRGRQETYYEIEAGDEAILNFDDVLNLIRKSAE